MEVGLDVPLSCSMSSFASTSRSEVREEVSSVGEASLFSLRQHLPICGVENLWVTRRRFPILLPLEGLLLSLRAANDGTTREGHRAQAKVSTTTTELDVALISIFARMLSLAHPDTVRVELCPRFGIDSLGMHQCYHQLSAQWFEEADGDHGTSLASLLDPEADEDETHMSWVSLCSSNGNNNAGGTQNVVAENSPTIDDANLCSPQEWTAAPEQRLDSDSPSMSPELSSSSSPDFPSSPHSKTTSPLKQPRAAVRPYTMGDDPLGRLKAMLRKTVGCGVRPDDCKIALCDHPRHYPEDDVLVEETDVVGDGFPFAAGFLANVVAYETLYEKEDRLRFICGCCVTDDVDCVRFALKADWDGDSSLSASTQLGLNILMVASEWGAEKVARYLLHKRLPSHVLMVPHPVTGQLPLHYGCRGGSVEVVKMLLQREADPNVPSTNGYLTPLHLACTRLSYTLAEVLVGAGADLDTRSKNGNWPLHSVCSSQAIVELPSAKRGQLTVTRDIEATQLAIVHLFVRKVGTDSKALAGLLDVQTDLGLTPLHLAIRWGRTELALHLIQLGANCRLKDINGNKPMHVVALYFTSEEGTLRVVRALLNKGAKLTSKNCVGKTPLDLAKARERQGEGQVMNAIKRAAQERGDSCCVQ